MIDAATLDLAAKGITLATAAGTVAIGWLLSRLRSEFPARADIREIEERQDTQAKRLEEMEREIADLRIAVSRSPSQADLVRLSDALSDVSGDVRALQATVLSVKELLSLLVNKHMESAP